MTSNLDTLGLDAALDLLDEQLETADPAVESIRATVGLIERKWGNIDASGFPQHADDAANTMIFVSQQLEQRKDQLAALGIELSAA